MRLCVSHRVGVLGYMLHLVACHEFDYRHLGVCLSESLFYHNWLVIQPVIVASHPLLLLCQVLSFFIGDSCFFEKILGPPQANRFVNVSMCVIFFIVVTARPKCHWPRYGDLAVAQSLTHCFVCPKPVLFPIFLQDFNIIV